MTAAFVILGKDDQNGTLAEHKKDFARKCGRSHTDKNQTSMMLEKEAPQRTPPHGSCCIPQA